MKKNIGFILVLFITSCQGHISDEEFDVRFNKEYLKTLDYITVQDRQWKDLLCWNLDSCVASMEKTRSFFGEKWNRTERTINYLLNAEARRAQLCVAYDSLYESARYTDSLMKYSPLDSVNILKAMKARDALISNFKKSHNMLLKEIQVEADKSDKLEYFQEL